MNHQRCKEAIRIDYPGSVISVNHYKGRRRDGGTYTKQEAKDWMQELGWLIKHLHLEDWELPLEIRCDGFFTSWKRSPDLSNLSKCTLDAIQETTGINDINMRWHDGDITIQKKEPPYLLLTIAEPMPDPLPDAPKSTGKPFKGKR